MSQILLVAESAVKEVKAAMGYSDDDGRECSHCTWFVEKATMVADECRINRFNIQVESCGRCLHFVRKTEPDAKISEA